MGSEPTAHTGQGRGSTWMQMVRTSRGGEGLLFTIGDNGLQPRGLHRSSSGHPDIAAGNVPGVPFHHMAAALALT